MNNLTGKRAARMLRVSTRGQDEDNQDRPTAEYITERGMGAGPWTDLAEASAHIMAFHVGHGGPSAG